MKLESPKVKIKSTSIRCGGGVNGMNWHLLAFAVSHWSVPKRSVQWRCFYRACRDVITDAVTWGDAWCNCTPMLLTSRH